MATLPNAIDRFIETDVLVIGGGGAGVAAAIAAARAGRRVLVAVKARLGKSGNTLLSSATVAMDGRSARKMGQRRADPTLTPDRWFEQIVRHGFFLSEQPLVRLFVEQAPVRVAELLAWARRAGQPFVFGAGGSWITTGKAISRCLRQGIMETGGIERLEDVMVCELIRRGDRVVGALALDLYTGELVCIRFRAAVLATGGFQPFTFKCTGAENTGDGIAAAYRAGAAIADMEFFLFAPGVMMSPRLHRGSILPMFLYATGQIRPDILTAGGIDLMAGLSPDLRRLSRDRSWFKLVHSVIWAEALAGGDVSPAGGVYFDFRRYSVLRYHFGLQVVFHVFRRLYGHRYRYQGRNVSDLFDQIRRRGRWEVGLCAEYSLGGLLVDETMATSLEGLFAAGEVTSGTFGANRTTRALTEMLVQGAVAGQSAAAFAQDADDAAPPADRLEEACQKVLAPLNRSGAPVCGQELLAAEAIADAALGIRRTPTALDEALKKTVRLRNEGLLQTAVSSRRRAYNLQWIQALEAENRLLCQEASIRSALARAESRGQHLRTDALGVDNERFLHRIHIFDRDGAMTLAERPPRSDWIPPESRNFKGVLAYARDCQRKEEGRGG